MKKTTKATAKKTTKTPVPKAYPHYSGAPIAATPGEVWKREMPEFKSVRAECWLLINRTAMTYTFANVYNDRLKASYKPEVYTYAITPKSEKKIAAKVADMMEVPPTDWPEWITAADHVAKPAARRTRKTAVAK
ncbi:MAG: hypothetical protein JWM57_530 [Phycisphaerales bacterium]|nr:hypothetical protein [Phycisphaerales bacterium]